MKRNKIMALAMLCSTLLSPVSKAHGGTKQDTQKSSDSSKNLKNTKNKKSDNPQEMYNSRWKTSDIVKYIEYVLGTIFIGGGSIYAGKKGYEYIRNSKANEEDLIELEVKPIEPKSEPKNLNINGKPKLKKVELSRESVAKKINKRLIFISRVNGSERMRRMRRVYEQVIESYRSQKNNEFQEIIETKIPGDKQDDEQFITWFQELNNEALDIILEGFSDEEKQFAKDNFKFYSFVWVCDYVYFSIAFAPKEKEIDLNGKKGKEAYNFNSDELFGTNFTYETYNDILKCCEINKVVK